ncbi:MAG: hypothetical protein ACRDAM_04810 [Casimicrobium sp.]
MKRPFCKSFFAILFAIFHSTIAVAQQSQWCYWHASNVWTSGNGYVNANIKERGDHITFCNINFDVNGVTPKVCKHWQQYLTLSVLTGKKLIVQYEKAPACDQMPTYGNAPTPNYIMLLDSQ